MSGKPYTYKEMKTIVDYLVQNKLYHETKGRKMWMEFANTKLTNRTWQSLKECFLKRILTDLYNPYYKLSQQQIISFKQGVDVLKETNKLEVHTISDTSSDGKQKKKIEQPTTSKVNAVDVTIEKESSKIPCENRSSTETVLVESFYETAEEIQNILELPLPVQEQINEHLKTLKDSMTHNEPLSPVVQEVIADFASESENSDREPVMEIDESTPDTNNEGNKKQDHIIDQRNKEEISNDTKASEETSTDVDGKVTLNENTNTSKIQLVQENPINVSENDRLNQRVSVNGIKDTEQVVDDKNDSCSSNDDTMMSNDNTKTGNKDESSIKMNSILNISATPDTLLPNNPEGFGINKTNQKVTTIVLDNTTDDNENTEISLRKRASSEDNAILGYKKKKIDKKNTLIISNKSTIMHKITENNDNDKTESNLDKPIMSKKSTEHKNNSVINVLSKEFDNTSPQMENLCLKSVSLFEDHFNQTKFSDSSEIQEIPNQVETTRNDVNTCEKVDDNDVVVSETLSDFAKRDTPQLKTVNVCQTTNCQRTRALANVFGFSTGAVTKRKSRQFHKRSISHNRSAIKNVYPGSSERTSDSDSVSYVSPPPRRKNQYNPKYLKPKSARIVSLEEEGGLFVMYGKRIYPLIRDGKAVKNYLTYLPEDDSDFDEDLYWKMKYEEEKKTSEALKMLLKKNKEQRLSRDLTSPIPINPKPISTITDVQISRPTTPNVEYNSVKGAANEAQVETNKEEKIKIKFTRNNEEVHLEGHWSQINPVFEQMVNIFHKDSGNKLDDSKRRTSTISSDTRATDINGISTPLIVDNDPEVHDKVSMMENIIFDEIAEVQKEERNKTDEEQSNATTRNTRKLRKISTPSEKSLPNRSQITKKDSNPIEGNLESSTPKAQTLNKKTENTPTYVETRRRRRNKDASLVVNENKTIQTRNSTSKKAENKILSDDEETVRYLIPPGKRGSSNKNLNINSLKKTSGSLKKFPDMINSDSLSQVSESTQGYHESDISLVLLKRKKNLSNIVRPKSRRINKISLRKSLRHMVLNNPSITSDSSYSPPNINYTKQSSSGVYNSESYQYMFPCQIKSSVILERIDETRALQNDIRMRHSELSPNEEHNVNTKSHDDVGSSSSVSLPLSPELSVVENISINKDLLNSIEYCKNSDIDNSIHDKCLISEDVTMAYQTFHTQINVAKDHSNLNKVTVTESLLNDIQTVKINDHISDDIDTRLQNLLLESTKKAKDLERMDVDNNIQTKKFKVKKRCSTPRKKREPKKSKHSRGDDMIVEERTESCSHGGRASCPPLSPVFDENAMGYEAIIQKNTNAKVKQKKNIIKVKILRPKSNTTNDETIARNDNRISVCTDSGINDTDMVIFPQDSDNNVELIHNHSETCLHANECIGEDSIEFIENSDEIMSIGCDSACSNSWRKSLEDGILNAGNKTLLNNNLQAFELSNEQLQLNCNIENGGLNQSPTIEEINSSLITEDLSDEINMQHSSKRPNKPTKWFLFSDEELSNTNMVWPQMTGANLHQIFPVTYAIPDLSDITEASKDNDDGRKPSVDLQSIFNSN